jgi:hypothetical protein
MLFQIAAFDHWQLGFDSVRGVQDTATHVHALHCHGDVAGCAESGGATANAVNAGELFAVPFAPFLGAGAIELDVTRPVQVALTAPTQPPQAT